MITLKELNVIKRGDGWYERTIQLVSDDPPFEAMLPIITHYVGKEKDMEANIDKEIKEILEKHTEVKKPDISELLTSCEKKANEVATILKAVK